MKNMKNIILVGLNFFESDGWAYTKASVGIGIFLITVFVVVGYARNDAKAKAKAERVIVIPQSEVKIYIIDGCEYMKCGVGGSTLVHKGNCTNHFSTVENSK